MENQRKYFYKTEKEKAEHRALQQFREMDILGKEEFKGFEKMLFSNDELSKELVYLYTDEIWMNYGLIRHRQKMKESPEYVEKWKNLIAEDEKRMD